MNAHCGPCGTPLNLARKGRSDQFCRCCTDPDGRLYPREQVEMGIAQWLRSSQPGITEKQALDRAGHYMKAIPA